jgi:drug/metabolite transporter (DMT)-like permease
VLRELLPLLALQGVVLAYVGTNLWYQAITRLDLPRTTAIVVPSIPLLSFGASFLLLGEVATPAQWAGLALTAMGVLAFVTAPHAAYPHEHIPAPTAPLLSPDAKR